MIVEFAERTGISVDDILGECRAVEIVAARHLYWKLLRDAGFTLEEIGRLCSVTHATVRHGVRVATERIEVRDTATLAVWNKVKDIKYQFDTDN